LVVVKPNELFHGTIAMGECPLAFKRQAFIVDRAEETLDLAIGLGTSRSEQVVDNPQAMGRLFEARQAVAVQRGFLLAGFTTLPHDARGSLPSTAPPCLTRSSTTSSLVTYAARSHELSANASASSKPPIEGTLFLDEIGDIALAMQARLLRVLQEREERRVGDVKTRSVDFRLIASTNRDLHQEVARERFRADLLYRLRVIELKIPALRQRPEDIHAPRLTVLSQAAQTRHHWQTPRERLTASSSTVPPETFERCSTRLNKRAPYVRVR
jgi:hypothetical protein